MLVALCFVDLLVILSNMVLAVKTMHPGADIFFWLAPFSDGLCHISITASVFLTVAITVERYYAICFPHSYQLRVAVRGHRWILLSYIIPTIIGAIILNVPKLLHVTDLLSAKNFARENRHIFIKFGIISQVFHPLASTCIIPVFILSILNYRILAGSKRMSANSQNDISMAKIMMTIVAVFITLSIPRMVLALYEVTTIPNILECYRRSCYYYITSKRWVVDSIIRYLVMLNSSTNFLIYCFVGSNFRRTLITTVRTMFTNCSLCSQTAMTTSETNLSNLQVVTHINRNTVTVSTHNENTQVVSNANLNPEVVSVTNQNSEVVTTSL